MNRRLISFVTVALLQLNFAFADAPPIKPYLLTPKTTYDTQPTLCESRDGTLWSGWVAYTHPKGDAVMVAAKQNGQWAAPEQVNKTRAQIVRPTLCRLGDSIGALWTESDEKALSRILFSQRKDGAWSEPVVISSPQFAAQNQEVALDKNGNLFVVWQEFRQGQYDVISKTFSANKWSEPTALTNDKYDDWDPAVACDSKNRTWLTWTSYRDGDYDLFIRCVSDRDAKEIRLGARGEYDLHPSVAADKEGRVWVAWDAVKVPRHGESGNMTITGANLKKRAEEKANDPENPDQKPLVAEIRLACLENGKILTLPKSSKGLQPPGTHKLAHTSVPRISVGDDGTVWVAYRALTTAMAGKDQPANAEKKPAKKKAKQAQQGQPGKTDSPTKKEKGKFRGPYWWNVFVQSYRGQSWSAPVELPESDGTLEEVAIVPSPGGLQIAYEMEHRRRLSAPFYPESLEALSEESDHHGDFGKVFGYNGDIYFAQLNNSSAGEPAAKSLVARKAPADKTTHPRLPRETAHYDTEIHGKKYTLLWGDLHKHSNISRCSTGNEPSPDDHYKYSHDICQYDFLAMSDHAEHTTDFNWWRIQKLADLYNVPGFFSVLYGYEWTATWPIGHHNIIWPTRPVPLLRAKIGETKTTEALWAALDKFGKPALTIPHTSADPRMGTHFDNHSDKYERLIEMFQACRGSYEYDGCPRQHVDATAKGGYVQDGWGKDYRMGTICSSDHGWGTAYAVVYATENSRQAAFDGLHDRRCYGSTTYGLVLDARMGEHFMGEEFSLDKPAEISVFTRGTAPIRSIEILSDGKIIHAQGDVKNPIDKKEARLAWTPGLPAPGKTSYYYVRVIQADDEIAWSSPFWVTSGQKEIKTSAK